jgi:hypothetical protein
MMEFQPKEVKAPELIAQALPPEPKKLPLPRPLGDRVLLLPTDGQKKYPRLGTVVLKGPGCSRAFEVGTKVWYTADYTEHTVDGVKYIYVNEGAGLLSTQPE